MSIRNLTSRRASTSNIQPVGGIVSPQSIPNLAGWYDFSAASLLGTGTSGTGSVADASAVGYATDRSGRGRNITQSTANNRPTFAASWTNSLGALTFNGTSNVLTNSAVPFSGSTPAFSFFAVFSRSSATGGALGCAGYNMGDWYQSGLGRNRTVWVTDSGGQSNNSPLNATNSQVTSTPTVVVATLRSGASHVLTYRRNGTSVVDSVNATPVQTLSPVRSITVGSLVHSFSTIYHAGQIGEIGFYERELGDAEAVALGRLLGARWGITVA
jgi:hypothetical protein